MDGFSRLPVYPSCSTDNKSSIVLQYFLWAINEYGLPARVRCDQGGENYDVAWYMLSHPLRGLVVEVLLQEGASITSASKDCCETYLPESYRFTINCSSIWKTAEK